MSNNDSPYKIESSKRGMFNIFAFLILCILGYTIGQLLGMGVGRILGFKMADWQTLWDGGELEESKIVILKIVQLIFTASLFLVPPIVFVSRFLPVSVSSFFKDRFTPFRKTELWILSLAIVFFSLPAVSIINEWNQSIPIPKVLADEDEFKTNAQTIMASFSGPFEFVLAIFTMAIMPAIGEEFAFRGIIQKQLSRESNHHIAIWVAAIFFSLIHFQFQGFIPRMLLGAIFGYMYHYSGSLIYPILGHLFNNSIMILGLYIFDKTKDGSLEIEKSMTENPITIIGSFVLIFSLLFIFRKRCAQVQNE